MLIQLLLLLIRWCCSNPADIAVDTDVIHAGAYTVAVVDVAAMVGDMLLM